MSLNEIYSSLYIAYHKERQSNELQAINKDFFNEVLKEVERSDSANKNEESEILKANIMKILEGIYERRKTKILLYIAYNKQTEYLTTQETVFYDKIMSIFKENRLNSTEAMQKKNDMLKSLNEMPQILLPSGAKLGPINKEQIIKIENEEDAEFLIKNSICERL